MLHENEPNMMVDRQNLIKRLKENRSAHKDRYDRMCEGYKVLVAEANEVFQELLKEELESKEPHLVNHQEIYLKAFREAQKPSEHLSEYDEVIEMLEWITEEEVRISLKQFRRWVRDEWSWTNGFLREGELPLSKSLSYEGRFGKAR